MDMTEKKIKYTQCIPGNHIPKHIVDALSEQPHRSGNYNWIFAFKGEINCWEDIKDKVGDYDIIQVNMTPKDMPVIPEIRRVIDEGGHKTKLVLNNDYVAEMWNQWKIDPYRYDQIQHMGDMVFGTEENQVSNMIETAHCFPHPTNTKVLKRLGADMSEKQKSVGFIYHWWLGQTYLPSRTMRLMKEKFGLKSNIFAYKPGHNPMHDFMGYMFDAEYPLMDFPDFADAIQKQAFLYDPNLYHTYGRNGVEAACLRVPVIGSNRVFSYRKLFPELTIDPVNHYEAMGKAKLIIGKENAKIINKILDKAYDGAEYFNYKNSKKRYLEALGW